MNNPISMIRITIIEPIKWAALLNMIPPSLAQMQALIPTCTTRKEIRNKPVNPITSFFPTEEVNNSDHFINDGSGSVKNLLQKYYRAGKWKGKVSG
jgi:hypothetical protein